VNIYYKKQLWKRWLIATAIAIVGASLWYTSILVNEIAKDERKNVTLWADAVQKKANLVTYTNVLFAKLEKQERKKVELWAAATKELSKDLEDYSFVLKVVADNTTVPVILTDRHGNPLLSRNLDSLKSKDISYLKQQVEEMRAVQAPLEITMYGKEKQYLYYKDSKLFAELQNVLDDLIQSFISEVAINSASVPVIYTDSTQTKILATGNIDSTKLGDEAFLKATLAAMASEKEPIEVTFGNGEKHYVFYQESTLLTRLKYYPYVMFSVVGLFLLIGYLLFSTARKAEQNQVWVGMSKETAHQLGTPLSSLLAWVEYLKMKELDADLIADIEKDVKRLEIITERFSKIGSVPKLDIVNLTDVVNNATNYIQSRVSKNVLFNVQSANEAITAQLNIPLFEWVIENICRNAVDAMDGEGSITIRIASELTGCSIEITDTGKGMLKTNFKSIFEPGFTSKERGWGLGLSLTKRIVENYHAGKVYVLRSEIGKGTTFRIELGVS
jgi:anti-sigma regulatory factor (Ser/Thr protein kinase)